MDNWESLAEALIKHEDLFSPTMPMDPVPAVSPQIYVPQIDDPMEIDAFHARPATSSLQLLAAPLDSGLRTDAQSADTAILLDTATRTANDSIRLSRTAHATIVDVSLIHPLGNNLRSRPKPLDLQHNIIRSKPCVLSHILLATLLRMMTFQLK